MVSLATIVPAHNEEGSIEEMAKRLFKVYEENKYGGQIILAANGCTDATVEKIAEIVQEKEGFFVGRTNSARVVEEKDVTLMGLECVQGHKSLAIARALPYAQADYVALIDADLQYHPEGIPELVSEVKEKTVVSGKRIRRADPFVRKIIPRVGHSVFNAFYQTNLEDINSGIKVTQRERV